MVSWSGIAQVYFAVSSWLWTLVLSYTIYCVIVQGKIWFQLWHAQCLCWIWPLVLALLPLTTSTYSSLDPDLQWCLIVPRSGYPPAMAIFWGFASFFFWLFVCILLMVYWGVMIQWRYWGSIASHIVRRTYEKVWLYPVALSVCWLFNVACVFIPNDNQTPIFYGLSTIFGLTNGIFNSTIFMWYNSEIMQRWAEIFRGEKDLSSIVTSECDTITTHLSSSPPGVSEQRESNAPDEDLRQSDSMVGSRDGSYFESRASQRETGDFIGGDWFRGDTDPFRTPNVFTTSALFAASKRDSTVSATTVIGRTNADSSANSSVVEMT